MAALAWNEAGKSWALRRKTREGKMTIFAICLFAMLLFSVKKIHDLLDHVERQAKLIRFQARKLVELRSQK